MYKNKDNNNNNNKNYNYNYNNDNNTFLYLILLFFRFLLFNPCMYHIFFRLKGEGTVKFERFNLVF